MSDKPKTIQEALAEVQRRASENKTEIVKEDDGILSTVDKWIQAKRKDPIITADKVKSFLSSPVKYSSPEGDNTQGEPAQSAFQRMAPGRTAPVSTVAPSPAASGGSSKPATGAGSTGAAAPTPKTSASAAVEKTPAAKPASMSFSQAYQKARSMAKPGQDPNKMQFKWTDPKTGKEGVYQSAATKKDYVSMGKQTKVDIGSGSETKPTPPSPTAPTQKTAETAGLPPKRPAEISGEVRTNTDVEKNFGQKPDASLNNQSAAAAEVGREAEKRRKQTQGNPPVTEEQSLRDAILEVVTREQLAKDPGKFELKPEEKKKMSEEMNPLISAFLRLQETKAGNVFEAAKKLTKKQDEKLDVVDDDKIDAKDLAALRAGKKAKMDEDEQLDEADPANDNKKEGPAPIQNIMSKSYKETNPSPFANSQKTDPKDTKDWARRHLNVVEDEEQIDELKKPTPETAEKVVNRATDRDEWSPKAANRLYSAYKKRYEPKEKKTEVKEGMLDPKDPSVQGGGDVTSSPVKSAKPAAPKKVDSDPSYQGSGEVTKGGKPVSVREGDSFIQRSVDALKSMNPLQKVGDVIGGSTKPAESKPDMRIIVTPKKPPKDGSANSAFPANEEVEQVEEGAVDKAKAFVRLGSKGMTRTDAIASKLSDRTGNWDFKKGGFTGSGKEQVKSRLKNVKGASDYALRNDDVQFSEEEIEFFNSVMEAEPVNKTPVDVSDKSTDKSASKGKIDITDERKYK